MNERRVKNKLFFSALMNRGLVLILLKCFSDSLDALLQQFHRRGYEKSTTNPRRQTQKPVASVHPRNPRMIRALIKRGIASECVSRSSLSPFQPSLYSQRWSIMSLQQFNGNNRYCTTCVHGHWGDDTAERMKGSRDLKIWALGAGLILYVFLWSPGGS